LTGALIDHKSTKSATIATKSSENRDEQSDATAARVGRELKSSFFGGDGDNHRRLLQI